MKTLFNRLRARYSGQTEPARNARRYATASYSQEGEDIILNKMFDKESTGFYVEVGSHHPFRFSNTYLFYKKGWRGICIDPLPGLVELFKRNRPRDIAIEAGVSDTPSNLTYYMFNEAALNTFDAGLASLQNGRGDYHLIEERTIAVYPLRDLLEKYLDTTDQPISFLSVDVEGFDLNVIKSNDWSKFTPRAIVVECLGASMDSLVRHPIRLYLESKNYSIYAITGNSVIFKRF